MTMNGNPRAYGYVLSTNLTYSPPTTFVFDPIRPAEALLSCRTVRREYAFLRGPRRRLDLAQCGVARYADPVRL